MAESRRGTSIRIFLADGVAEGLWLVEKSNWTGVGLMWPRAIHPRARSRTELDLPGVYVLVGPAEQALDKPRIYVGEADVLRKRLDQHQAGKDFWTRVLVFTSKDGSLNKAHVKYLESRLLSLAQVAQRAEIDNGTVPQLPALSEPETADIEAFLDEMLLIYPVLDMRAFERVEAGGSTSERLGLRGPEADAEGQETPEGFLVFAGSRGRPSSTGSFHTSLAQLRSKLVEEGVLAKTPQGLVFTRDYQFNSPSTAAAVILGRNANGRTEWKDSAGRTLKELQTTAIQGG
jgi:hypothetical protein